MAHTAKTLELTPDWDLQLTAEGNIKLCRDALALAQDCANEIRLWTDDAYFQKDNGISWLEVQLARKMNPAVLKAVIREACFRVDGVADVVSIVLDDLDTESRELHGEITIQTEDGQRGTSEF